MEGSASRKPPFPGVNSKGKVPALVRDDGTLPTKFRAIAIWLARTNPEDEARLVETMAYLEGKIHGQGVVHQTAGLRRCSARRLTLRIARDDR